jgi:hypothetical protein
MGYEEKVIASYHPERSAVQRLVFPLIEPPV